MLPIAVWGASASAFTHASHQLRKGRCVFECPSPSFLVGILGALRTRGTLASSQISTPFQGSLAASSSCPVARGGACPSVGASLAVETAPFAAWFDASSSTIVGLTGTLVRPLTWLPASEKGFSYPPLQSPGARLASYIRRFSCTS